MRAEEFLEHYSREIDGLFEPLVQRYGVGRGEFALALHASIERHLVKPSPEPPSARDVRDFLGRIRAEELCLAVGCARGSDAAWEALMGDHGDVVRSYARQVASRYRWSESTADDLVETAWGDLYGIRGGGERRSKFASYGGVGSLRGWLRAVLHQIAVDHHRKTKSTVPIEDAAEPTVPPPVTPEPGEDRLRAAVRAALAASIAELDGQQKLVLSYYYFDGRTLKEIGKLFGVHEATASRWLARAQTDVRKGVERILRRDHGMGRAQIDECLALAAEAEQVDVRGLLS